MNGTIDICRFSLYTLITHHNECLLRVAGKHSFLYAVNGEKYNSSDIKMVGSTLAQCVT